MEVEGQMVEEQMEGERRMGDQEEAERQLGMEGCRGPPPVDDITWIVEGEAVLKAVTKMEECAERSLRWADGNAVRFETSKREAICFTRNKRQKRMQGRWAIQVGEEKVKFAMEATRWLGVLMDSALMLAEK